MTLTYFISKLPPFVFVIAICFLVSLSVYYKLNPAYSYLRLFPPFLLATLCTEILGPYLNYKRVSNLNLYNFFSTFEFCFYLWAVSLMIHNKRFKLGIRLMIPLYAAAAVINILFIQQMKSFHTVTYATGCLLVVAACICYFMELFRLPKFEQLGRNPAFWISSGLLFFYCCSFPLYGLINAWRDIKLIANNFQKIGSLLNIFLYSLFTIAFVCIRTRKSTSSSS
jgi:hypothetical protein